MIRTAEWLLAGIGAAAGLAFVFFYLGGYPRVFAHEEWALIPLLAGLAAAVLDRRRRDVVSVRATWMCLTLLAGWAIWLWTAGVRKS